ncbi:unnamed protein product [Dicrocoelium dendriticum]|nr:unnamed protein product [Dicrocoelium dendriticum]
MTNTHPEHLDGRVSLRYALVEYPIILAQKLNNEIVHEILNETDCYLDIQSRVLNRRHRATQWTKGTVVEVIGRTVNDIERCNSLIAKAVPFYASRRLIHEMEQNGIGPRFHSSKTSTFIDTDFSFSTQDLTVKQGISGASQLIDTKVSQSKTEVGDFEPQHSEAPKTCSPETKNCASTHGDSRNENETCEENGSTALTLAVPDIRQDQNEHNVNIVGPYKHYTLALDPPSMKPYGQPATSALGGCTRHSGLSLNDIHEYKRIESSYLKDGTPNEEIGMLKHNRGILTRSKGLQNARGKSVSKIALSRLSYSSRKARTGGRNQSHDDPNRGKYVTVTGGRSGQRVLSSATEPSAILPTMRLSHTLTRTKLSFPRAGLSIQFRDRQEATSRCISSRNIELTRSGEANSHHAVILCSRKATPPLVSIQNTIEDIASRNADANFLSHTDTKLNFALASGPSPVSDGTARTIPTSVMPCNHTLTQEAIPGPISDSQECSFGASSRGRKSSVTPTGRRSGMQSIQCGRKQVSFMEKSMQHFPSHSDATSKANTMERAASSFVSVQGLLEGPSRKSAEDNSPNTRSNARSTHEFIQAEHVVDISFAKLMPEFSCANIPGLSVAPHYQPLSSTMRRLQLASVNNIPEHSVVIDRYSLRDELHPLGSDHDFTSTHALSEGYLQQPAKMVQVDFSLSGLLSQRRLISRGENRRSHSMSRTEPCGVRIGARYAAPPTRTPYRQQLKVEPIQPRKQQQQQQLRQRQQQNQRQLLKLQRGRPQVKSFHKPKAVEQSALLTSKRKATIKKSHSVHWMSEGKSYVDIPLTRSESRDSHAVRTARSQFRTILASPRSEAVAKTSRVSVVRTTSMTNTVQKSMVVHRKFSSTMWQKPSDVLTEDGKKVWSRSGKVGPQSHGDRPGSVTSPRMEWWISHKKDQAEFDSPDPNLPCEVPGLIEPTTLLLSSQFAATTTASDDTIKPGPLSQEPVAVPCAREAVTTEVDQPVLDQHSMVADTEQPLEMNVFKNVQSPMQRQKLAEKLNKKSLTPSKLPRPRTSSVLLAKARGSKDTPDHYASESSDAEHSVRRDTALVFSPFVPNLLPPSVDPTPSTSVDVYMGLRSHNSPLAYDSNGDIPESLAASRSSVLSSPISGLSDGCSTLETPCPLHEQGVVVTSLITKIKEDQEVVRKSGRDPTSPITLQQHISGTEAPRANELENNTSVCQESSSSEWEQARKRVRRQPLLIVRILGRCAPWFGCPKPV